MFTQFAKARACVFLMLTCGYCAEALAEEPVNNEVPETKEVLDNKIEQEGLPKPNFIINYSSVFDNYIPFDEMPELGWKEANDNVGRIGGWRAYAKIVQEEVNKEAEQAEVKKKAELEKSQNRGDQK